MAFHACLLEVRIAANTPFLLAMIDAFVTVSTVARFLAEALPSMTRLLMRWEQSSKKKRMPKTKNRIIAVEEKSSVKWNKLVTVIIITHNNNQQSRLQLRMQWDDMKRTLKMTIMNMKLTLAPTILLSTHNNLKPLHKIIIAITMMTQKKRLLLKSNMWKR